MQDEEKGLVASDTGAANRIQNPEYLSGEGRGCGFLKDLRVALEVCGVGVGLLPSRQGSGLRVQCQPEDDLTPSLPA